MIDLTLATRNAHKVHEIQTILGKNFRARGLDDLPNAPEFIEDADTFEGNATRKATQLAQWLALKTGFVLADDSGLEVDALNGAPGVHSARFAAMEGRVTRVPITGNAPDSANIDKLLRVMEKVPLEKRTARFRCVLALVSDSSVKTFEGACEGRIALEPSGTRGFGYDPLFIPNGYKQSFAELGEDIKNQISHRARALRKLREHLTSTYQAPSAPAQPEA